MAADASSDDNVVFHIHAQKCLILSSLLQGTEICDSVFPVGSFRGTARALEDHMSG